MRNLRNWKKHLSLMLAAMMLILAVASCAPSTEEDETTPETTPETTLDITETTGAEDVKDPWESAILFAGNGASEYRIVVPTYATTWEREAAETLATYLAMDGQPMTIEADTTPLTSFEIIVGYTNRNNELQEDFFTGLGKDGYHIRMVGGKLFIGANTEAGMKSAIDKLSQDLLKDDTRVGLYDAYVCQAKDTSVPSQGVTLSGEFGETISYAQSLVNGVQTMYKDGSRTTFVLSNQQMTMISEMGIGGHRQVSGLYNAYGVPYILDTMTAFVELTDGKRFESKDSTVAGRVNIYRYGAYYYESHVLGQNFGDSVVANENVEVFDFKNSITSARGNNINYKKDKNTQNILLTIKETSDPYINFSSRMSLDTSVYDAVRLTIKATDCSSAAFYLVAGNHSGIDGSQVKTFSITPDGEFHTYIIPLRDVTDYTGKLTTLRLDLDGAKGEVIEISGFDIISSKPSGLPAISLDRTMHTYADKQNHVLHFVTTDAVEHMSAYGMETVLPQSRVTSLMIVDKNGQHDSLDGVDWDSVVAVGFDIDRAGVFGYILTTAENTGAIKVTLQDGNYVITQSATAKATYKAEENFYIAQRLYTDMTHNFDGFLMAVKEERNPLTMTVTSTNFKAKSKGYDAMRGAYCVDLSGTDFSTAYYKTPDLHYRVDANIKGDDADRKVYVYSHTIYGNLECGALLDSQNTVLPITMQVCKNFQGENEEPIFDKGDTSYGEVYFPLCISAGKTLSFSVLNLYQNWGKVPLKQISSIQFIAPYYHLSTGATETNCIAPYFVYGKDRWTLPDFRAMSAPLWSGQPQHTSAGRLHFLEYTDSEGNYANSESKIDTLVSIGPVYSDIWMNYLSDDGRISVDYRHMEMPQTDENRTYYQIQMTVLEDITFANFKEDFNIFSMDGRAVYYEQLSYLDEGDQPVTTNATGKDREVFYTLGKNAPFVAYHHVTGNKDYVNMALIIKDWDIKIGGEAYDGHFLFSDRKAGNLNEARLTLDLGEVTLKAGDTINVNMILLPWGSQLTPKGNIDSVLQVRQDTCLAPITVTPVVGEVIADAYLPCIKAVDNTAEFTLTGGENNMAVRVYGFDGYEKPVIEEKVNGKWVTFNVASDTNGYDGYGVYYDGDGTYSYAFIVSMNDGEARTFRVTTK